MKALTKKEILERIERELPDDALVVGVSIMAGEFFELDEEGTFFAELREEDKQDLGDELPEGVTHVFEVM